MPRPIQPVINPPLSDKIFPNVLLVNSGNSGVTNELNFLNRTIPYFDYKLNQTFQYTLIDNRGGGTIRVCYNRPSLLMTQPINGAKTLSAGESLYIEEDINFISIYYVESSLVEMILKSNGNQSDNA